LRLEVSVPQYRFFPKVFLDPRITALIVVDMQVDFVSPKGKLFVPEAPRTIPAIRHLIAKARKARVPVIFTQDWHRVDDPEFSIWPSHAQEGTRGAQLAPGLKPLAKDHFIRKRTYDAFFSTDLDLLLRQKNIQNLVISRLRGYEITVAADAISSLTPFDQAAALRQISFIYQGKITNSRGVIFKKK
jgi:nicotinamidase-related amidase